MKLERDAFYAMLGIAMRAGQLSLGESGVLKTVSSGTALFIVPSYKIDSNKAFPPPDFKKDAGKKRLSPRPNGLL